MIPRRWPRPWVYGLLAAGSLLLFFGTIPLHAVLRGDAGEALDIARVFLVPPAFVFGVMGIFSWLDRRRESGALGVAGLLLSLVSLAMSLLLVWAFLSLQQLG